MLGLAGLAHLDQHLAATGFAPAWMGSTRGWQSKRRLGDRGDGDAVSCHMHSAPCFVFKGPNTVRTASTLLRSELDLEALSAALAPTFFIPAFPVLQNSHLSPFTSPT